MNDPVEAIAFYAVFVFAVTVHEAAHAWVAMKGGDLTAYAGGQVSLDPLPHMKREPFGMVILPILTVALNGFPIGYASAPYDPSWAMRHPRRAAWMALAGPGANFAMTLLAFAAIRIGVAGGQFMAPDGLNFTSVTAAAGDPGGLAAAAAMLLSIFFSMNLLLFVLNMLPVPPLDGSGAIGLVLPPSWAEAYQSLCRQPIVAIVALLAVWNFAGHVFRPCFRLAVAWLYPDARYE
ncbi:MAG: site-2 protease family protein [Deltaproteobacteria bacterium]|nr:site-2 protease family protein [Deltaproteobacteria bacterium]